MERKGRLRAALAEMRGRRALLVGDFVLDGYVYGETVRVSREAPVLVVRKERSEYRLGGAANAAANLLALGMSTELVGAVGQDDAGARVLEMLRGLGGEIAPIQRVDWTTPQKTRVLAGAFGTARQQVLRLDDEPAAPLPEGVGQRMATELAARGRTADVVVVSDYGAGVVCGPVIETALRLATIGKVVCVDSRHRLALFRGVTAVKPNVPEAAALVGFPLDSHDAVERAGRAILSQLQCQICLITQGRRGMTLMSSDAPAVHVDITDSHEVTDVTGAGDTVTATLAAALGAGLGPVNGMRLANCAAGIVVMRAGVATVSPEELIQQGDAGYLELESWGR